MTLYKNTKLAIMLSLIVTLTTTIQVQAESAYVGDAKIVRTLASKNYGGCMILLDIPIASEDGTLASCPGNWASLDCNAVYHTQAESNAMWSSALVAYSLNKTVVVRVNDQQKFNGYCVANRIDLK